MQMMCQISLDYSGVCARLLCAALLCNPHDMTPELNFFSRQGIARLPVFFALIQHMGLFAFWFLRVMHGYLRGIGQVCAGDCSNETD